MHIDYGETLYQTGSLKLAIPAYLIVIRRIVEHDESIVGLVSTGSSGAILATGILLQGQMELYHIHVGKRAGHRGKISGVNHAGNYIFVDDFIDKGVSVRRCKRHLKASRMPYVVVGDNFHGRAFGNTKVIRVR